MDQAAASLNIKPELMEVPNVRPNTTAGAHALQKIMNTTQESTPLSFTNQQTNTTTPSEAWNTVLSNNFDTASQPCLLTLLKIIDNILSKTDPKVRAIRYANPNFQQRVGCCRGALEFLFSLGFEARYAPLGGSAPETLELTCENRQVLLRGREVLILSAMKDFGMKEEELPKLPVLVAAPVVESGGTLGGFDIYKGHSVNITAQQMGVTDPYANKSLSTTERTLQNLEAKKKNMELQLQQQHGVEMDRCLMAYLPGDGPSGGASGGETVGESKGDSSLVAARMKRMEEERKQREEGGFTTKAMRDLERMKKAKVCYCCLPFDALMFSTCTHVHFAGLLSCSNTHQFSGWDTSACQIPPVRNHIDSSYHHSIIFYHCISIRF
jgi:hypothetical protein